ncbi:MULTISPECIES: SPOR domain-containing protein [Flavobacterium]|uniref:SPOR domain-containing protein n=1 Tax=Flavobacterium TaxID=237 RepID=UPI001FCC9EDC|nr:MULTISPECIES: SPOR domain-containing protein [Flavobacterium]UOK42849.1 SPOR domain-containing protein [Flavobacterium enshiense]
MRILRTQSILAFFILSSFSGFKAYSQPSKINIVQDPKFEMLLNEKRKINSSITVNDRYKVQIFYGTNEEAKKNLSQFKKEFRNLDGTIIYSNPSYKVWVGTFKTRIEAEKNYKEILKKYPTALLIRPNK